MARDDSTDDYGEADGIQESLLAKACRRRDLFQVQALLRDKADANERSAAGETPLLEAAAGGDVNVVALLLGHGADVKSRSKPGFEVKREALSSLPVALDPGALAKARARLGLGGRQGGGVKQGGMSPLVALRKRTPKREAESAADHSVVLHVADVLRPVLVVSPLWQQATATVVILHGLLQSGQMLERMARELARRLPHVRFVAPTAPTIPSPGGVGPAWYDVVSEMKAGKMPPYMKKSHEEVMDIVALEKEKGIVPERIVIAGFSMGGVMAAHAALTAHHQFGGLCLMGTPDFSSGVRQCWVTAQGLPVLQVHGKLDRMAAFDTANGNADVLRGLGCKLQFAAYDDVGHTVSAKMLEDIRDWLTRRLPDPSVAQEVLDAAAWVDSDTVETSVERDAARAAVGQNIAKVEQNVAEEARDSSGAQSCEETGWVDHNSTEAALEHNAAKAEVERNAAEEACNNSLLVDYSAAETAAKQNAVETGEQTIVETDATEAAVEHNAANAEVERNAAEQVCSSSGREDGSAAEAMPKQNAVEMETDLERNPSDTAAEHSVAETWRDQHRTDREAAEVVDASTTIWPSEDLCRQESAASFETPKSMPQPTPSESSSVGLKQGDQDLEEPARPPKRSGLQTLKGEALAQLLAHDLPLKACEAALPQFDYDADATLDFLMDTQEGRQLVQESTVNDEADSSGETGEKKQSNIPAPPQVQEFKISTPPDVGAMEVEENELEWSTLEYSFVRNVDVPLESELSNLEFQEPTPAEIISTSASAYETEMGIDQPGHSRRSEPDATKAAMAATAAFSVGAAVGACAAAESDIAATSGTAGTAGRNGGAAESDAGELNDINAAFGTASTAGSNSTLDAAGTGHETEIGIDQPGHSRRSAGFSVGATDGARTAAETDIAATSGTAGTAGSNDRAVESDTGELNDINAAFGTASTAGRNSMLDAAGMASTAGTAGAPCDMAESASTSVPVTAVQGQHQEQASVRTGTASIDIAPEVEREVRAHRQDSSAEQLAVAAKLGNIKQVKQLLKKDADPNMTDAQGEIPLFTAVRRGDISLVAIFLLAKADPSKRSASSLIAVELAMDPETRALLELASGSKVGVREQRAAFEALDDCTPFLVQTFLEERGIQLAVSNVMSQSEWDLVCTELGHQVCGPAAVAASAVTAAA